MVDVLLATVLDLVNIKHFKNCLQAAVTVLYKPGIRCIFGVIDGNFAIGKELFSVNCFVVRSGGRLPHCCDGKLDAGENS